MKFFRDRVKHMKEDVKYFQNLACMKKVNANPLTEVIFAKPIKPKFRNFTSLLGTSDKLDSAERKFVKSVIEKHHDFVLSHLNEKEREHLVQAMEKVEVSDGDVIIEQDSVADYLYVLAQGSIRYLKDGQEVGTASDAGEIFGELALLYDCPRAATVEATGPGVLYRVSRERFRTIQAKFVLDNEKPLKLFKISPLFEGGSEELMESLAECAFKKEFSKGEILIKRGEPLDEVFFLKEGRLLSRDVTLGGQKLADTNVRVGDAVGERAVVLDEPSPCTIECLTDGEVYVLTKERFLTCTEGMDRNKLVERTTDGKILVTAPFLKASDICRTEIKMMLDKLEYITLEPGEVLATIGEETEPAIYWVSDKNKGTGYVDLIQKDGNIKKYGPAQIFSYGRQALVASNLAKVSSEAATAYGKDHDLLNLKSEDAIEASRKSMTERGLVTAQHTTQAQGTETVHLRKLTLKSLKEVIHDTMRLGQHYRTRLLREDAQETLSHDKLEKKQLLGQGTFGQVWLCREPTRDLPYALKIQYKRELILQHQAAGVVRESSIMRKMHHPFVTGIVHAQQDYVCLYMVMELFPGGELRSLMRNETKNHMTESETKFYAACILEGLSYMHRREYVYRDLKGENVMVDKDGYCVIIDLGFAKHVPDKTFTFCGTPIFIAPEVLLNKGHDKSADIWSFGVMLFEMLFGTNPFFDYDDKTIDQRKLFKRVVKAQFQTPVKKYAVEAYKNMSKEAKHLIKKILVVNPEKRLGCLTGEDLDIRNHPWFSDIDWGKLYRKELKAPWIPSTKDPFDGSNFNKVKPRSKHGFRPLYAEEQEQFDGFC